MEHLIHLEYLILALSGVATVLRFSPLGTHVKELIYAIQGILFIMQMYQAHIKVKKKNSSATTPKLFVAEVAQHYLETHPDGRKMARASEIDEKVEDIILKSEAEVLALG